jgi:hypothetical protein
MRFIYIFVAARCRSGKLVSTSYTDNELQFLFDLPKNFHVRTSSQQDLLGLLLSGRNYVACQVTLLCVYIPAYSSAVSKCLLSIYLC